MSGSLVCFALPEESRPFERRVRGLGLVRVLITGIGRRNADLSVRRAFQNRVPRLVLTCGFAGSLDPSLRCGTVLYEPGEGWESDATIRRLVESLRNQSSAPEPLATARGLGQWGDAVVPRNCPEARGGSASPEVRLGRFYCSDRIAITAAEKRALRVSTGADAVEMESGAIRSLCRDAKVPCLTVRVISDEAEEDLPVDFNALMTAHQALDLKRLAWTIARSPRLISPLLRLQRRSRAAAGRLAEVLGNLLGPTAPRPGGHSGRPKTVRG